MSSSRWRHALLCCLCAPALLGAKQVVLSHETTPDATQDLTTIEVSGPGQFDGIGQEGPVAAPEVPPDELRRQSLRRLSRSPMAHCLWLEV